MNSSKTTIYDNTTNLAAKKKKKKKSAAKKNGGNPSGGNLFKYSVVKKSLAGRISPDMEWVSGSESDFTIAGDAIYEARELQKEFLPLLNWWYKDPYRSVATNVSFPLDLKAWVDYNNERTPRIKTLLKTAKSNPIRHQNMIRHIRENCLHRVDRFLAFSSSQKAKMDIPWKTRFLKSQSLKSSQEWEKIIKFVKARKKSMKYRLPYNF